MAKKRKTTESNGDGPSLNDIVQKQRVANRLLQEMLGEIRAVGGRLGNFIGTASTGHRDVVERLDDLQSRVEALEQHR